LSGLLPPAIRYGFARCGAPKIVQMDWLLRPIYGTVVLKPIFNYAMVISLSCFFLFELECRMCEQLGYVPQHSTHNALTAFCGLKLHCTSVKWLA